MAFLTVLAGDAAAQQPIRSAASKSSGSFPAKKKAPKRGFFATLFASRRKQRAVKSKESISHLSGGNAIQDAILRR